MSRPVFLAVTLAFSASARTVGILILLTLCFGWGIKELFGKDAETFIAGLSKEETTQNEPEK